MGFLQIYRKKRAQQWKFYPYIFSEQLFGENICLKFPLLGSFLAMNLKKPQSRKLSTCQSKIKYTLIRQYNVFFITGLYITCCPCLNVNDIAQALGKNGLPYALSMGTGLTVISVSSAFLNFTSLVSTSFVKNPWKWLIFRKMKQNKILMIVAKFPN